MFCCSGTLWFEFATDWRVQLSIHNIDYMQAQLYNVLHFIVVAAIDSQQHRPELVDDV